MSKRGNPVGGAPPAKKRKVIPNCPNCTFINPSNRTTCEICDVQLASAPEDQPTNPAVDQAEKRSIYQNWIGHLQAKVNGMKIFLLSFCARIMCKDLFFCVCLILL